MKRTFILFAGSLVTIFSVSSLANGTNAITPQAATNSMKDVSAKVEAGFSNIMPVVSNLMGAKNGPAMAETLVYAETNTLTALTNSALPEMGQAGKFLVELKKSGHLPGVPQDSHGDMYVNAPLSEFQEAKYPFTVTFDLVMNGDSLTNHYTVVRPAKGAAWQMEKSWRTDTQGHTVIEWPVK